VDPETARIAGTIASVATAIAMSNPFTAFLAPLGLALGGILSESGDYAAHRQAAAGAIPYVVPLVFGNILTSSTPEQVAAAVSPFNWNRVGLTLSGGPETAAFGGGYELGAQLWPQINPTLQQAVRDQLLLTNLAQGRPYGDITEVTPELQQEAQRLLAERGAQGRSFLDQVVAQLTGQPGVTGPAAEQALYNLVRTHPGLLPGITPENLQWLGLDYRTLIPYALQMRPLEYGIMPGTAVTPLVDIYEGMPIYGTPTAGFYVPAWAVTAFNELVRNPWGSAGLGGTEALGRLALENPALYMQILRNPWGYMQYFSYSPPPEAYYSP
jgi:hypothetical protein